MKVNIKNIVVGVVIVLPVLVLGILVYNPSEREAIKKDKDFQGTVGYMSRMIDLSIQTGTEMPYEPDEAGCSGDSFCFISGDDGYIVYTKATSLAWKEYCNQEITYILYSSADTYNGLVCDSPPSPGKQKFVNQ